MNVIKFLFRCYCLFNGFWVKPLTERSELKAAFDLKNQVNQELTGLEPLAAEEEFVYPEGIARLVGVYTREKLIGTMYLMDLTKVESIASKLYADATFTHSPETTYEIKSFVVDTRYQHGVGRLFNILMFYAVLFTQETNRTTWLVITSNKFYDKVKRKSGLKTQLISDQYQHVADDTPQSRYSYNYIKDGLIKDYSCYYIYIPKKMLVEYTLNYFKLTISVLLKKIKPFPSINHLRKTSR